MLYDIVRKLPEGSQIVLEASGDRGVLTVRAGRSRFTLQTLPESDFPDLNAGDMTHSFRLPARRSQEDDRQDAVRDLDRRNPLLSERHLSAQRDQRQEPRCCARSRPMVTGWRSSKFRCRPAPTGMPGVIMPHKTVGEMQRLIDGQRRGDHDRIVGRQDPLHHRRRGADLEADRRHVPGLCRA